MVEFREQLIEKILVSADETLVASIIRDSLSLMVENGTNMHIIARFESRLESDLIAYINNGQLTEKEQKNTKEAIRVINEIHLKNNVPML